MHRTVRIKITELNPNLICVLCGGYYIDACTIIECLHSFCRTCITKYLDTSKYCPICDSMVHKTKPLLHVKSDKTLQDLVYKLVPGLYKNEMKRRREYYAQLPTEENSRPPTSTEERGVEDPDRLIYTADEKISLSLELLSDIVPSEAFKADSENNPDCLKKKDIRYLQCPAAVSMSHLKKFLRLKFDLPNKYKIDIYHSDEPLKDYFTLMDVAYIYMWRRTAPLRLVYSVYERAPKKRKCTNTAEMARVLKQARMTTDEEEQEQRSKSSQSEKSESDGEQQSESSLDLAKDKGSNSCSEENGEKTGNKVSNGEQNVADDRLRENDNRTPKPDENDSPAVNGVSDSKTDTTVSETLKCDEPVTKSVETKKNEERTESVVCTPKKNRLLDRSPGKNVMNNRYSPKINHNGKVFSPTFFKKQKSFFSGSDEPLDMTKKTLKEAKKTNGYSPVKTSYATSNGLNGSLFPAYEFTD